MRRLKMLVLMVGVLSLLVGNVKPAAAQAADVDVEAVAFGHTNPTTDGPLLDRTVGSSSFTGVVIQAAVGCDTAGDQFVAANLLSASDVEFSSDDDITDGFGTIDSNNTFEDTNAVHLPSGNEGNVNVTIEDGEFERIAGVVTVRLDLEVRAEIDPNGNPGSGDEVLTCEADVSVEIVFELVPDPETPETPTAGFLLVGAGARV